MLLIVKSRVYSGEAFNLEESGNYTQMEKIKMEEKSLKKRRIDQIQTGLTKNEMAGTIDFPLDDKEGEALNLEESGNYTQMDKIKMDKM